MKETIIKAATAVVCAVIICVTAAVAVGNYSDALNEAAKQSGTVQTGASADENIPDTTPDITVDGMDGAVTETPADGTVEAPDENTDVSAPDAGTDTTAPDKGTQTNDPTSYSKEQAVRFYTESMNKSFNAPKTTIKTAQTIAISVDEMTPKAATKLAKKIVDAYAKTTESTRSFSKGIATDDGKGKAADHVFPANLDPKGAKTATVTKKGNDYEINILVVPEDATLTKFPVYNRQCSFPLDLGSIDLFGLKITQADFTYEGTKIKATVGADGYVKYAEVYMPLAGEGGGNFIGIGGGAAVSGSMKKTATFTY